MAKRAKSKANGTGANLGFEEKLWAAADKLRGHMDAAEYKHVVLGLVFLKYISDAFQELHDKLAADRSADPEDRDEYTAENIFWVPKEARWPHLQAKAKQPTIGKLIDDAMSAIEKVNPSLKGVLAKDYGRASLDKQRLGELIDLIGTIGLGDAESRSKDVLGRVYEYFLGKFANVEGKGGGEFYTPQSVVKLLVEMIEPYSASGKGARIYDPCCGSGGMCVSSEEFMAAQWWPRRRPQHLRPRVEQHHVATLQNEPRHPRHRRQIGPQNADTRHNDLHKDLKADFIPANPPFIARRNPIWQVPPVFPQSLHRGGRWRLFDRSAGDRANRPAMARIRPGAYFQRRNDRPHQRRVNRHQDATHELGRYRSLRDRRDGRTDCRGIRIRHRADIRAHCRQHPRSPAACRRAGSATAETPVARLRFGGVHSEP